MSIFSKKNEFYLLKVQSDNETEPVALAASDIVEAIEGSTSNFSADTMQVKILSGTFDVEPVVIGARSAAATLILPIRSWGNGSYCSGHRQFSIWPGRGYIHFYRDIGLNYVNIHSRR